MKKSKHIQLVLITAALSSCSRVIIPNEPAQNCLADTSLSRQPVDWEQNPDPVVEPYYELWYAPSWNIGFYYRPVYTHPVWRHHPYPGEGHGGHRGGGGPVGVGAPTVVRGGFGLSAKMVTVGA